MTTPDEPGGQTRFSTALADAIERSGLSLTQISEHLARAGHPVSTASLSFWCNDLRTPTRRTSRPAIEALEDMLGLRPGALTSILDDEHPVMRHPGAGLPPQPRLADALHEMGTGFRDQPWPVVSRTHVTISGLQSWRQVTRTLVLRAAHPDTTMMALLLPVPRGTLASLSRHRGGAIGPLLVLDELDAGPALLVTSIKLPKPLQRGQLAAVEYQVDLTGATGCWVASALPGRTPLLTLQASFLDGVPEHVHYTHHPHVSTQPSGPAPCTTDGGVMSAGDDVQYSATDTPAGLHLLQWTDTAPAPDCRAASANPTASSSSTWPNTFTRA